MKKKNAIHISRALAVICLAGMTSYAQEETIADEDLLNMMESVSEAQSEEVLMVDGVDTNGVVDDLEIPTVDEAEGSTDGSLISVRLNRVSLEEAIDLFAQLSGANIIVPELTDAAQISVNLKDVEWRPALQSILDTYNYELYQRVSGSNVFSVRRRPAGAPEPQVVETFSLNYATVPNAAALIRELLPADAKVSEFASRNILVVKSTESSLSEVRAVLSSIDVVRQQVFIESKFMELTDDAQKDLGVNWSSLQSYGAGLSLDQAAWGKEMPTGAPSENLINDMVNGSATFPLSSAGSSEYALLTTVLNADQFNMALSALEQNKGVNIVSNPKIIVANEEKASISIIRKEPNLKQERQQSASEGSLDNITYELDKDLPFFDYGIKLEVTPSVNTSSNITVQINPSLTRKYADKEAGNNTYPIYDEKSIQTVFNLADGQTAAIGGLTELTEGEEERKVPVLGSIPFLGRLFSWKQTVSGQDETIIFVTVGLANTQQLEDGMGLPNDSELARRQLILDKNNRQLRDHSREYFEAAESNKLEDLTAQTDLQEAARLERRQKMLDKEAEKAAKKAAKSN